jgi:hypothetical protein
MKIVQTDAKPATVTCNQERLSSLFDAMECHGNSEGTETQLGDAEQFLRQAFELMTPSQQTAFLDSTAVTGFIAAQRCGW